MACATSSISYATLADLEESGLPPGALGSVPATTVQKILLRASRYADGFLGDKYVNKLACPFDQALIHSVCQIASYWLMTRRGYNPDADMVIRQGFDDATAWLKLVAQGQVQICTSSDGDNDQPAVITNDMRNLSPADYGTDFPAFTANGWGV